MATSVAHGLIGIACYCAVRNLSADDKQRLPLNVGVLFLVAMLANVPDLDMIVSLILYGDHRVLHGGVTHMLLFSIFTGCVVWLMAIKACQRKLIALAVVVVLASHALVDFLTGPVPGVNPTYGSMAFWPLAEARMDFPVTIFKGVEHSNILPGALLIAFWEFVFIAPITAVSVYFSKKKDALNKGDLLSRIYLFITGLNRNVTRP